MRRGAIISGREPEQLSTSEWFERYAAQVYATRPHPGVTAQRTAHLRAYGRSLLAASVVDLIVDRQLALY